MYVCMYVCIYVCIYLCMYLLCICVYAYACMYVYVCIHVCKYVCMYVCMYLSCTNTHFQSQLGLKESMAAFFRHSAEHVLVFGLFFSYPF